MTYFFSKLPILIIAALIMAGLCLVTVLCAEKNEASRNINEERCNNRCGSCANAAICTKPEKKGI